MSIDFTNELSQLITYVSRVAIAIRMYSNYGNPDDPDGPEDVRWLSDSLHNFSDLSEALRLGDTKKALWACDFLLSKHRGYQEHPTFKRNERVPVTEAISIFENIKQKLLAVA